MNAGVTEDVDLRSTDLWKLGHYKEKIKMFFTCKLLISKHRRKLLIRKHVR